jgi:hypothetical protein
MDPPGFVMYLEAMGLHPSHCRECVHHAHEIGTAKAICWRYGVYVSIYSSCSGFERMVGSDLPVVSDAEIREKFPSGLNDLMRLHVEP